MPAHLSWEHMSSAIQALFIICLATTAVLRAWIAYRQVIIREKARTRRFNRALEGVHPKQRTSIIVACGKLEASNPTRVRRGNVVKTRGWGKADN
jgi:hypothetical protein